MASLIGAAAEAIAMDTPLSLTGLLQRRPNDRRLHAG
jgi:hypothetical protein